MFNTVEETVAAIRRGEVAVLTDDERRENEGDLVCAGVHATPANLAFMVTHGRGVLCAPVSMAIAKRLHLAIPAGKHDPRCTAFTQSLDAIQGNTTGVSAFDRANTIATILKPASALDDFYSPGHVFPLLTNPAGTLGRTGHTEGIQDLTRLAGFPQVSALCEILKDDGHMARLPDLEEFCGKYHLCLCSIASIIAWRKAHND